MNKGLKNKGKNKIDEFKKESNIGFSLYGTPSESYCQRAVMKYEDFFIGNKVFLSEKEAYIIII